MCLFVGGFGDFVIGEFEVKGCRDFDFNILRLVFGLVRFL